MTGIPRELTKEEYAATFSPPMVNVTENAEEIVDLWGYANPVIEEKYHSCAAWEWRVMFIYEARDGSYQHINIPVPKDDTYLSVIVDKAKRKIVGHYVLDLRELHPDWPGLIQPSDQANLQGEVANEPSTVGRRRLSMALDPKETS